MADEKPNPTHLAEASVDAEGGSNVKNVHISAGRADLSARSRSKIEGITLGTPAPKGWLEKLWLPLLIGIVLAIAAAVARHYIPGS